MATIIAQDIKTGEQKNVTIADGAALTEVQAALEEQGMRLVPSTQVMVMGEDGKTPVPYPYPADMPAQKIIDDLAKKGWTLAREEPGTAVPRGPVGGSPVAKDEANALNVEGLSEGAQEMFRDAGNFMARPFMDPAEYATRIVTQARERKAKLDDLASRSGNLDATGGATAYPDAFRMLPRAAAEAGVEYALTRGKAGSSALYRIGTGGAVAGGFEVLDQTDRSFVESLGTGGGAGALGVGVAASALGETPPAAKRWLGRAMTQALEARGIYLRPDAHPFHLDALQPDLGNRPASEVAGIPLTPAQALQGDALTQMYQSAARTPGGPREQLEVRQAAATRELFADVARRYLPPALTPNGIFDPATPTVAIDLASKRYDAFTQELADSARRRFNATLLPGLARAGASKEAGSGVITGGAALIPASDYLRTLKALVRRDLESGVSESTLAPYIADIKRIEAEGGWTLGGFQNRLMIEGRRGYGSGMGQDPLAQGLSFDNRALYQAMQRDLDKAIALADPDVPLVGGAGAPNRTQYTGSGNLRAVFNDPTMGPAGATPDTIPVGPVQASGYSTRPATPARDPMALGDPSFDPAEEAYRAMDEAALSRFRSVGNTREAARSLKAARDGFAEDMEVMRQVNDSSVAQMFGQMKGKTADEFRAAFMGAPPDKKAALMAFADQHFPREANYLRGALFQSVVDEARAARAVTHGDVDTVEIGAFARAFGTMQRKEMEALLPAGMSEEGRQRVLAGLLTMETLTRAQGADAAGKSMQFIPRMRSAAINVVLQNVGFISSFLAGDFTPGMLERSLYREAGIRGWMRLGQAKPGSAAAASALASIADQMWLAERDAEEIARRAEALAAEEQQNIQLRQNQAIPQ